MVDLSGTGDELLDRAVIRILGLPQGPPGVCLAISAKGATHWAAGGSAQLFDARGALPDPPAMGLLTRTDLGSVTKIIATTMGLMALVDGGAVRLSARIDAIVPEVARAPGGAATLSDLLEHRAGLWEW